MPKLANRTSLPRLGLQALLSAGSERLQGVMRAIRAAALDQLRRDARHGLRTLARSPGFSLLAVASLSLGIAVATCAYSEVNGLILRDLPGAARPDELAALEAPTSYPLYQR